MVEIDFYCPKLIEVDEIRDLLEQAKGTGATNKNYWRKNFGAGLYVIASHPKVVFQRIRWTKRRKVGPISVRFDLILKTGSGSHLVVQDHEIDFSEIVEEREWKKTIKSDQSHAIGLAEDKNTPNHKQIWIRPRKILKDYLDVPFRIDYIGEATKQSVFKRALIRETHEGLTRTFVEKIAELGIPNERRKFFTNDVDIVFAPLLLTKESNRKICNHAQRHELSFEGLAHSIVKDAEKAFIFETRPRHCQKLYSRLLQAHSKSIHNQDLNLPVMSYRMNSDIRFYSSRNRVINFVNSRQLSNGKRELTSGFVR